MDATRDNEMEAILQRVVTTYRACGTLKGTAREIGHNDQTVRKLLITAGEYQSDMSTLIAALREDGLTVQQIAERVGLSIKAVSSYLPYSKGSYLAPPSVNAQRISRHRAKNSLPSAN